MINRKLYFKLVFYITGTLLVLFLFSTVLANMLTDSKLFNKEYIADNGVVDGSGNVVTTRFVIPTETPRMTAHPVTPPPISVSLSSGKKTTTPSATKKTTLSATPTSTGEESTGSPEPTGDVTSTPAPDALKIEIINRSGIEYAEQYVKGEITALGNIVVIAPADGLLQGETLIIARKNGLESKAQEIRNALKFGTVTTEIIEGYEYDFTIIIGYNEAP